MTKKFAVAAKPDGANLRNGEFVVPTVHDSAGSGFVGLESGRSYSAATVVYTGVELSVEKILAKAKFDLPQNERARKILGSYLDEIASQRVGNVIATTVSPGGDVRLSKLPVKSRAETSGPRLP